MTLILMHARMYDACIYDISMMRLKFCDQRTNERTNKAILGVGFLDKISTLIKCLLKDDSPHLITITMVCETEYLLIVSIVFAEQIFQHRALGGL